MKLIIYYSLEGQNALKDLCQIHFRILAVRFDSVQMLIKCNSAFTKMIVCIRL